MKENPVDLWLFLFTGDGEDDPLADVLGLVADSLEPIEDHECAEEIPDGAASSSWPFCTSSSNA